MDSDLRFDIYERVYLPMKCNVINVVEYSELMPQIILHLEKDQIKLIGCLVLKNIHFDHKIPVEITIPANRFKDAWLLDADIENFKVEFVGHNTINVTGSLVISEKESVEVGKVKVRQEVKEAIERIRKNYTSWDEQALCYIILNSAGYCQYSHDPDIVLVHEWSQNNEFSFVKGLMNGFEAFDKPEVITITPEQKKAVVHYYLEQRKFGNYDKCHVIKSVLELIGIEWEELK